MKKLGKLTVNEMRDYVPLNPEEQMAMKGGLNPVQWVYIVYYTLKIAKEARDLIKESQTPTPSGSSVTRVYGPDSVLTADGNKIYYPDSLYLGSGN